ncbi:hypothetical protein BGZ73_008120 [Actinomortierella ambigua]|nr:hypothetical protein BGZ73_008120 [Actinomortierella ambigua]
MAEFDIQQLVLVSDATNDAENLEHLGPTMKDVYRNNKMKPFLDQLSLFIQRKEMEIERMCNSNYQDFVQSVDRLLSVRQGTVDLKNKINVLNTDVQQAGISLAKKKRELIESKKILENIAAATETLKTCVHFLDLANRVNVQVENRKYYSALRIVDEIQAVHLKSVIQFEFARHMQDCIPILQQAIKDAVITEMRAWLVSVRAKQKVIGELAMDRMVQRQQRWRERATMGLKLRSAHNVNSAVEAAVNEENEVDLMDLEAFDIDFRPLYQCLHIFDELGLRAELKVNFAEDRHAQAKSTLSSQNCIKDRNIEGFKSLLQDIIGFFIIEHVIMHSTINFRTQSQLDELCELVTNLLVRMLNDGLGDSQNPDLFLDVKLLLMIYIQTMESYNYPVHQLNDLLLTLFRTYTDQLEAKFSTSFKKLMDEDEYKPMTVDSQGEYEILQSAFTFREDDDSASQGFPRTLPFSKVVPYCCEDIRSFVMQFYKFIEGFKQEQNELDELVKDSLDTLLIQHVHSVLLKKLESQNLSQIAQIIVNLEYFEGACGDFEQLLANSRSTSDTSKIDLQATGLFRETRRNAESRIGDLIKSKINDVLELAEYEWMAPEVREVSTYIEELEPLLSAVLFAQLHNLPEAIKKHVYSDAFNHLATMLHGVLTDPNVTQVNINFVATFDKDIRRLEDFARALNEPRLQDTFTGLRQLTALLMSDHTDDPDMRERMYPLVRPEDLNRMLEKLSNAPTPTTPQEKTARRWDGMLRGWGQRSS